MKLFTKDIDKKLFQQYQFGNDLENQKVVAKIFNPYGRGTWYLLNSDPNDSDYIWAIIDLFEVEIGSISRNELETIKVPPFRLGLERDMYFDPVNAAELYRGLLSGKQYAEGGSVGVWGDVTESDKMQFGWGYQDYDFKKENIPTSKIKITEQPSLSERKYLVEDIKKNGIKVPIVVLYDKESDKYHVKNGNNRAAIAKELGITEVPSIIAEYKEQSLKETPKAGYYMPNDEFEHGGEMEEGGEIYPDKKRIYFSSLAQVIDAIHDIAAENGYDILEIFPDLTYGGIGYGQTKKVKAEVEWNGKEKQGKSKKREKNTLNVSIYRMDSGNYELNTYFAYADGGELTVSPTEKANSLKGQQKLKF